tara:strand:+ start:37 stop:462 length:426 start_codon:yes stop_codon:yes gene_type:complete
MPAKKVKFYAKRPNMEISIDGKVYKFEGGVLAVDPKLAEQVERHHLYRKNHIFMEKDAVTVDGKMVSMKDDPKLVELQEAKKSNKDLIFFQFNGRSSIDVDAGPHKIRFEQGKAAVEPDVADYLRKHVFFRQGRIQEVVVG